MKPIIAWAIEVTGTDGKPWLDGIDTPELFERRKYARMSCRALKADDPDCEPKVVKVRIEVVR